jgi:hypothetical protein
VALAAIKIMGGDGAVDLGDCLIADLVAEDFCLFAAALDFVVNFDYCLKKCYYKYFLY